MSMAKELTGKQIASLLMDKRTQQVKDPELVAFTSAFYNRIANANPANITNDRSEFDRRLDAMARLLVGDETCAAVAFDGQEMQIATNKNSHANNRIKIHVKGLIKEDPCAVDNYQIFPVLYLSYNDTTATRFVSSQYSTYYYSKKYNALKLDADSTNKIKISLTPQEHMIPFIGDMDMGFPTVFNKTIPLTIQMHKDMKNHLSLHKEQEWDTPVRFDTPYNALQRRAEQLLKHMSKVAILARVVSDSDPDYSKYIKLLDESTQTILMNSLCWEAAAWYKEYNTFPSQYVDSNKSKLDNLIKALNEDFQKFRASNAGIKGTVKLVEYWLTSVVSKISSGEIESPDYVKQNVGKHNGIDSFLAKAERYFIDVTKLNNFIARESQDNSALAMWLLQYWSPGLEGYGNSVRIVDSLADKVHSELRILYDYLLRNKVPDYIATSILCCAHCKLLMDGFDIESISGTHARAYGEWFLPHEEFIAVDPGFLQKFLGEELYARYHSLNEQKQASALQIAQFIARITEDTLKVVGINGPKLWNTGSTLAQESDEEDESGDSHVSLSSELLAVAHQHTEGDQ